MTSVEMKCWKPYKIGYSNNFEYFCSVLKEFQQHIENYFTELTEASFLLACSGGLDSVVLAYLCTELNLNFALAHCNFNLRGDESDVDEKFVENLAKKFNKKYFVISFDTIDYMSKRKVSLQVSARELRYDWFYKLMKENGIEKLVTAHHADDNLETFFINLSRGTGLDGLTGIPQKTDSIARPLLKFSREQILEYASSKKLKWREDSSNKETKYLRNKIRHQVVPLLKELNPTFLNNFANTQNYLGQSAVLIDNYINQLKESLFIREGDIIKIEIEKLQKLSPIKPYVFELFKNFGFTELDDVVGLISGMSGKKVFSKTHRLLRDRNHLLLQELAKEENVNYELGEDQKKIDIPFGMLVSIANTMDKTSESILYIDKEKLKYPLVIRKWRKGDYFYPFGMDGQKKKVSKFFKDEKMSLIDKEKQWVLCSDNKIVWIIGKRADERYKIRSTTKSILKFTLL